MNTEPGQSAHALMPKDPSPVPYTLRLGVTGHRNLADPEGISVAVGNLLLTIKQSLEKGMTDLHQTQIPGKSNWQKIENQLAWNIKRMLATSGILSKCTDPSRHTPLNWKVISSLAIGADCLVARKAMEKLNASLEVVLPFDVKEYRKDFSTKADLEEFNDLFSNAVNHSTIQNVSFPVSELRKEGYENAGIEVVDSCELLIAVWDGKPALGQGGTADIVKYACSVNRPVIWINALQPGLTPVIVTQVEDQNKKLEISDPGDLRITSMPLPKYAATWSSRYLLVAEYNRDRSFSKKGFDDIFNRNAARLESTRKNAALDPEHIHPLIHSLLPHYARADLLAIQYQNMHIRSASWLYRLAAIAVAVVVIQTLYFPEQTAWVILEIVALLGAVAWFRISIVQHWHEKWLNYRHLAERIRILLFHSLAGPQSTKQAIQKQQLPFYPGPGGWVLDVFDYIRLHLPGIQIPKENISEVKKFILDGWITEQADYHNANAISKNKLTRKDHLLIGAMLVSTLVAAILHMQKIVHDPFSENLIIALAIILPAFASAQHAIGSIHDYERIATRSVRMNEILLSIKTNINQAGSWEELNLELQRAEEIMSAENHEWCISLSFRRVSLPV